MDFFNNEFIKRISFLLSLSLSFVFINSTISWGQLPSDTGSGSSSTSSSTLSAVTDVSATIDVTDIDHVFVSSSFQLQMNSKGANAREASFRLADNADNTINSGILARSLTNAASLDHGIGSVVYIFDVSAQSGSRTFVLEHSFSSSSKTLTTDASIVAIGLRSDSDDLLNAQANVTSAVTMTDSWSEVTGSQTGAISTVRSGGFMIAASIESITSSFSTEAIAEWKLQYKKGSSGTWTDIGSSVERSMSNTSDKGLISLSATLADNSSSGDYYFRVAHKRTSATSTIQTNALNLIAISLATSTEYLPILNSETSSTSTTSTSKTAVLTKNITPSNNTDLYIHAQYAMTANAEAETPTYDLYVNNSIFDGQDQIRYISSSSDAGAGASIGLAKSLLANTNYDISLRHSSSTSATLTTSNVNLSGFGLSPTAVPLPIKLLYLKSECGQESKVNITWATSSEINNDYFTLLRSTDGKTWEEISAIDGLEDSNEDIPYEFTDIEPMTHDTYYKLRQTDFDGRSEEFEIISIYCKYNHKGIKIYPNPVKQVLNLSFFNEHHLERPFIIDIYNKAGELCISKQFTSLKDDNSFSITLPESFLPGTYFMHSRLNNEYFFTSPFIKK